MIEEEAKKVIRILKCADNGCEYCVNDLLNLFKKEFPKFKYLIKMKKAGMEFLSKKDKIALKEARKEYKEGKMKTLEDIEKQRKKAIGEAKNGQ